MKTLLSKKKRIRALLEKKRRRIFWGIGILVVCILLYPSWRSFFNTHSKFVPTSGGILTEATIGETKNLNPLSKESTVFDKDIQKLLYSGLLEYNPTSNQIEPALASFRISEDGLEYIATLKDSARFSNGKFITTDDVLFTYESVIQNQGFKNSNLAEKFEYVQIEKIDEKSVRFILPEPNSYFPFALTTPILEKASFPVSFIEEVLDPSFIGNKNPVGSGPFTLENIVPEREGGFRVFLKKNKHYFKKTPYIDHLVFYVYPDINHLRVSHEWPIMISKIPTDQFAGFTQEVFGEYSVREYLLPRFSGIFFNLDQPFVSNLLFRNALSFAVQKENLLKNNPGWEQIDSLLFFEGIDAWHEYDLKESKKLLKKSGVSLETNESIRLITSTTPPVYSRFAQTIKNTLTEELGIYIQLDVLSPKEFDEAVSKRDYDMVLFGQDFSENSHSLSLWHSSQNKKINLSNLTNESIDFLINEIYLTGAKSDLFQLGQKLNDLVPAIPIATPKYHLFVSPELKGFSETFGKIRHHNQRFSGIESWYFKEKQVWNLPKDTFKVWEFIRFLFRSNTNEKPLEETAS